MNYEKELFLFSPEVVPVMEKVKKLNNGSFLRRRTGWIDRGINSPESIYEHSCKVGLAAHYLLKTQKAVEMAISHDFPEIEEHDYTPGTISENEKQSKELLAIGKLTEKLPNGNHWERLWKEFEKKEGMANIIFELDKICPAIQALEYMKHYKNNRLEEFYPYTKEKIKTPELISTLEYLYSISLSKEDNPYKIYFEKLEKISL